MNLTEPELSRIRSIACEIRDLKQSNYDRLTWDAAKAQVTRAHSTSAEQYYRTLALLEYFLDEERALMALPHFLEKAEAIAANLKERDNGYAVDEAERALQRSKIENYLSKSGEPKGQQVRSADR